MRCDGKIVCGCSGLNKHILGDIQETDIKKIWNSTTIRKIREYQLGLKNSPPEGYCSDCFINPLYKSDIEEKFRAEKLDQFCKLPIELLLVETTITCNLNCLGCLCKDGFAKSERKRNNLSLNDFKKVVDELRGQLKAIHFYLYGDPFANKEIFKMIAYAKKNISRLYTFTSTNGHFLTTTESHKNVIECGLDEMVWSIDGSTQKNYEKYRQGGNLNLVLQNMTSIINLRNRLNKDRPKIIWRYILFNWNDSNEEMEKAYYSAKEIGVDKFIWHLTSWPENAPSKRFVQGSKELKTITGDLDPITGTFLFGHYYNA